MKYLGAFSILAMVTCLISYGFTGYLDKKYTSDHKGYEEAVQEYKLDCRCAPCRLYYKKILAHAKYYPDCGKCKESAGASVG